MQQIKFKMIWYGSTIFLSSAILLVLEITAGRLIAPYVGVTIYSWTSIIGVILAGLSLGNWLGGRWADKGGNERSTGIVLALSGLFCLFSLLALSWVAPVLQNSQLDLVSSSFLYVLSMFFIPAVLLGIPTPLLTTLALNLDQRTGHIVGRMHALAAMGSIIGTFLTGFVLIQTIGSRSIVILSAVALFLLSFPFFRGVSKKISAALIIAVIGVVLLTQHRQGYSNPCEFESNYFCLRVIDSSEKAPFGTARALVLDHLIHGINHESEADMLIAPYVHLMQELVTHHFTKDQLPALSYFFAGGGSYTQPRAVKATYPRAQVTVAELDPTVTEVVQNQMYVDTQDMNVIHGDARTILYRLKDKRFDVIVTDAFHDIAIPYHLVTREYIQLVKSRMNSNGLFTTNVVDAFPNPKMVKSLMKTLQQEFDHVDIWLDEIPQQPQRMTFVISASNQPIPSDIIESVSGFNRHWFRINTPLQQSGTAMNDLPIFSDDYVPVESLIADLLFTAEGL
jgi:spermidine synthase